MMTGKIVIAGWVRVSENIYVGTSAQPLDQVFPDERKRSLKICPKDTDANGAWTRIERPAPKWHDFLDSRGCKSKLIKILATKLFRLKILRRARCVFNILRTSRGGGYLGKALHNAGWQTPTKVKSRRKSVTRGLRLRRSIRAQSSSQMLWRRQTTSGCCRGSRAGCRCRRIPDSCCA